MAATNDSDYDSSCSSITPPASCRRTSWLSNLSSSSVSVCSSSSTLTQYHDHHKPHKANQAAWESMARLRRAGNGRIGLEHFKLLRRVGSGDIGSVYLCQLRNPMVGLPRCFYAMKVVDREAVAIKKKLQRAEMEKEILGMLDHPFLPSLYAEFEASHYSCLVMEYCPGGDLYAARLRQTEKRFSLSSAKFYAAETLLALEYLHMMGIVYRDLKPENVLVREDGHIMLSDFDLSFKCEVVPELSNPKPETIPDKDDEEAEDEENTNATYKCTTPRCTTIQPVFACLSRNHSKSTKHQQNRRDHQEIITEPINARSKSFVGTHEYLAPEVISGQGHGSAVDWWTLGVFLYEMLYGTTPFKGENNEKTLVNILKKTLSFPNLAIKNNRDEEEVVKVQDLISKLLIKNPKKRIGGLKGSIEIKKHGFFKGVNWALIRSVKPPWVPNDVIKNGNNHNKVSYLPKLMSKKEMDLPYEIPHEQHFDYF